MELESRSRNLVWTVSGDYTLKLNPDVERYAKEPDTVLYDTIRQGAFSCYFDREAYSLYLVKKVYSGAAEGELMMLAQLVTEEAVSKRLESERPGVKGFRRRAAEEILDHSFESLSKNETGRLKLEYLRGRREEDEGKSPSYSGKTREWMELLKHASETADTMELIRVTDEPLEGNCNLIYQRQPFLRKQALIHIQCDLCRVKVKPLTPFFKISSITFVGVPHFKKPPIITEALFPISRPASVAEIIFFNVSYFPY